ncbi:UNVERIFIED_CONTAM: dihydrofolate synthase/folylpolyglutamate synthase [Acetivibrio alkalicellulosi]
MDYNEAVSFINSTSKFGIKLGLDNIIRLLELMGNPHKELKYIHVAGTNGKGSVVAMLSSVLFEAGYKVGRFTSPYFVNIEESIVVNGEEIEREEFARIVEIVRDKVELMQQKEIGHPTQFEILTAIAFEYFYKKKCDIVVLETGLGGRFDSTNVIEKSISVICSIGYDHMDKLGETLSKIAYEKAGIIKENSYVLIYPGEDESNRVIFNTCKEKNAVLNVTDFKKIKIKDFCINGQEFEYGRFKSIRISMLGEHQVKNAALVLDTVDVMVQKGYNICDEAIKRGLLAANWPGRFEVLKLKPVFIIDGAHNLSGVKALKRVLQTYFPQKKIIFIMGVFADKDYTSMVEVCSSIALRFITVTPKNERALEGQKLAEIAKIYCNEVLISDTIECAVKASFENTPDNGVICAFGSLSYLEEIRSELLNRHS